MDRELEGGLAGDSIFRQQLREIRNIFTNFSSTPGSQIRGLSDMGIQITRTGTLEIDEATFTSALANNYDEIRLVFSVDTNDQTDVGEAILEGLRETSIN